MTDLTVDQLQEVNSLSDRVMLMFANKGDRAPYYLRAEDTYLLGQPVTKKLAFNVPADADFFGERLNLYYQYRIINVSSVPQSDRAFRPAMWSSWATTGGSGGAAPFQGDVVVELSDDGNGPYQNSAWDVAGLYSSPYGVASGSLGEAITLYQGGLDFPVPYVIRRNKTAQLTVTPRSSLALPLTNSNPRYVDPVVPDGGNFRVEFRVVAEFTGYKNVRAFK